MSILKWVRHWTNKKLGSSSPPGERGRSDPPRSELQAHGRQIISLWDEWHVLWPGPQCPCLFWPGSVPPLFSDEGVHDVFHWTYSLDNMRKITVQSNVINHATMRRSFPGLAKTHTHTNVVIFMQEIVSRATGLPRTFHVHWNIVSCRLRNVPSSLQKWDGWKLVVKNTTHWNRITAPVLFTPSKNTFQK